MTIQGAADDGFALHADKDSHTGRVHGGPDQSEDDMQSKYELKSAWPDGAQWEWFVENTENGRVAYPEHGYSSKADCARWIEESEDDNGTD